MLKSALALLSGNAFGSVLLLVRNLAIARLISVEDYGVAATFAIILALVEMASNLGLQQLIIQDNQGEDENFQAGLHGFNVMRGCISSILLFALSVPLADFLNIPDAAWAYQILAIIPLVRAFEHLDAHRLSRQLHFTPLIILKTVPVLISLISVWPLYLIYEDFRILLYSAILQWALFMLISHAIAKRPYRISWEKYFIKKCFSFGWPLLINSVLLFLVFQGDKLIVGRLLGMETLALFSLGVTLTLTPTLVAASTEQQFFLPLLSKHKGDAEKFKPIGLSAMQASMLNGLCFVVFIFTFTGPIVDILLGEKYILLKEMLPWFAVWQATRILKNGNTTVALALAKTSYAMIANAVRVFVLPITWILVSNGADLMVIIQLAIIAEVCAYFVSLYLILEIKIFKLSEMVFPIGCVFSTGVLLCILQSYTVSKFGWVLTLLLAAIAMSIFSMKELRYFIWGNLGMTASHRDG